MPVVELATDARWRPDAGRYVEVCPKCSADRDDCRCGHDFARLERSFFVTKWTPAVIAVRAPETCPHCGGAPTKKIAVWNRQHTRYREIADHKVYLATCKATREPVWMYLAFVASVTLTVMFGLLAFAAWQAVVPAVGFLALAVLSWRAYAWVRFVRFDHRSYRFRVRRRDYADALARANGGRVL